MTTPLVHTPEVHDAVWEAYDGVLAQRRTRQLAAVLRLNEDESAFEIVSRISLDDASPWQQMVAQLPPQDLCWIFLALPYATTSGGLRGKACLVSWCPDALARATFKETVRVKTSSVLFGAALAKRAVRDGAIRIEAHDLDDLGLESVLERVSRFERDAIDHDSLACLL